MFVTTVNCVLRTFMINYSFRVVYLMYLSLRSFLCPILHERSSLILQCLCARNEGVCGSGDLFPLIRNLRIKREWMFSFTLRLPYPQRKFLAPVE